MRGDPGPALAASAALGELPFATQELEQTAGFLSRTGDYTAYLLRQAAAGTAPSPEDLENLRSLSDTAGLLEDNLLQLRSDVASGLVGMDEASLESGMPSFSGSFLNMEQEFPGNAVSGIRRPLLPVGSRPAAPDAGGGAGGVPGGRAADCCWISWRAP